MQDRLDMQALMTVGARSPLSGARSFIAAALLGSLIGGTAIAQGGPAPAGAPLGTPPAAGAAGPEGAPAAEKPIATLAPELEQSEVRILADRVGKALKNKEWARAAKDLERLISLQPDILDHRLSYALCLYEQQKTDDARKIYDAILGSEPENIQALLAIARIYAKQAAGEKEAARKAELSESAKENLKKAAKNGLNALRAIKVYGEFGAFTKDVQLQLEIIREPQRFQYEAPSGHDPFYNPLPTTFKPDLGMAAGSDGRTGMSAVEQEALVKRLEQLFAELDPLVAKSDYAGLGQKWGEIDEIRRQESKVTSIDLLPKFKELMKRHKEKLPVVKSLLLRAYYTDGEAFVDKMRAAYESQDLRAVFDQWAKLESHAKKMRETDDQFAAPADDLLAQGKPIVERAQRLQEIEQFRIVVTAIVRGGSTSQAIVNNRIVAEGDIVYDLNANPIQDLRVTTIGRRRVKFTYKGLEFEPKDQLKAR